MLRTLCALLWPPDLQQERVVVLSVHFASLLPLSQHFLSFHVDYI